MRMRKIFPLKIFSSTRNFDVLDDDLLEGIVKHRRNDVCYADEQVRCCAVRCGWVYGMNRRLHRLGWSGVE